MTDEGVERWGRDGDGTCVCVNCCYWGGPGPAADAAGMAVSATACLLEKDRAEVRRLREARDAPQRLEVAPDALRDLFAGQALGGMASNLDSSMSIHDHAVEWYATQAYRLADAMLAARKAKP